MTTHLIGLALVLALQATLSVRTVLVALPVTVTDTRGRRVTGLTQDNFRVFEDGVPQPITVFQHGDSAITLGLVVDHSTSMRDNLPLVRAATAAFSLVTRPDDEMFVVGFNEHVSRPLIGGQPFTSDATALAAVVGATPALGRTALHDAIIAGLTHLAQGRWDKRTLIVVSDGGDNASAHTFADVQALAAESRAVIYAIGLRGTAAEESPRTLKRLSDDTGGTAYFPRSPRDVSEVFERIVRDLREQYTLGYVPESYGATGTFRKIQVAASDKGGRALRVRTRTGYVVPNDRP